MRWVIFAYLLFCPTCYVVGKDLRKTQEMLFQLAAYSVFFSAFFFNIKPIKFNKISCWLGLFGIWAIFLFGMYNFSVGKNCLINIVCGLLVYFACLLTLEKEDFKTIRLALAIICGINLVYVTSQFLGYDPLFNVKGCDVWSTDYIGFFAIKCAMGMYFAFCMPIIASIKWWIPLIFFFPIGLSVSSGAMLAAIVSYLFYLWHIPNFKRTTFKMINLKFSMPLKEIARIYLKKRWQFFSLLLLLFLGGSFFILKIDSPMGMYKTRPPMWKVVLKETLRHPVLGYGLNSIREGNIRFIKRCDSNKTLPAKRIEGNKFAIPEKCDKFDWWDNVHNEYLQLFYEFGVFGLICVVMILIYIIKRFINIPKPYSEELIGCIGYFIALMCASIVQFPLHLARLAHLLPVMLAFFVILTEQNKKELPDA